MTQVYSSAVSQEWAPISPEGLGQERGVLVGGGDRGYGWGLGGKVGLFSPQRQNAPSPLPPLPHHPFPPPGFVCPQPHSSLFCHPAIPLCLAYTMGAQCLGSWRCILPAHWGANTAKLGGGGWYMGARNTIWRNATLQPTPHQPPDTYQTHPHIHRWSAQNKCHPTKPWHSAEKQP